MEPGRGAEAEGYEGCGEHLGGNCQGLWYGSLKGTALLTYGETFPNRTEGSVKKHWYKVYSIGTGVCNKADCSAGYALRRLCGG